MDEHEHVASPRERDLVLADLASRQHGVVTRSQIARIGFGSQAIARYVARGRLHRVHRGVFAVGHAGISERGRWMAATMRAGAGAALSHLAAVSLLGVWRHGCRSTDVVTARRIQASAGVTYHRDSNLHDDELTWCDGIPVTTLSRAVVDLVDVHIPHQITHVIHEAAYRGLLDLPGLEATIERHRGKRGIQIARDAVTLYKQGSAGTRSAVEVRALRMLEHSGLPRAGLNVDVMTATGPINVDLFWAGARLCVELDGPGHGRPFNVLDDVGRDHNLTAAGYVVVRFPADELWRNPQRVLRGIKAAHHRCMWGR